jgi:phospholipid-binding lipoprotein MlaA
MESVKKIVPFLLLSVLAGCSATEDNPDPYREINRDMLEFNLAVDRNILKPTALAYEEITPDALRKSVSHFLNNMNEPFYCLLYLLTCDVENAAGALFRFVINSTLGVAGLFDVADLFGLTEAKISYKDALRKLQVPTGDYLVLPVAGSLSARDTIAGPICWFADPVAYFIGFPWMFAKTAFGMINDRAQNSAFIDATIQNSMDLYSTVKSIYLQKYGENAFSEDFFVDEEISE